jgi:hypothetical protein
VGEAPPKEVRGGGQQGWGAEAEADGEENDQACKSRAQAHDLSREWRCRRSRKSYLTLRCFCLLFLYKFGAGKILMIYIR